MQSGDINEDKTPVQVPLGPHTRTNPPSLQLTPSLTNTPIILAIYSPSHPSSLPYPYLDIIANSLDARTISLDTRDDRLPRKSHLRASKPDTRRSNRFPRHSPHSPR